MLRKKLKDLGIPDWGPRPLLQRRHTEWMNLWNANCDAKNPKTKEELRRDLDIWERTQGGAALQSGPPSGPNAVMAKTFDAAAWSTNHDDDFKRLIENARKNRHCQYWPCWLFELLMWLFVPCESEDESQTRRLDLSNLNCKFAWRITGRDIRE